MRNKKNSGFTLIELLIVIAVIGVLAAGVLVAVNPLGQIRKARDAQRKSNLRMISNALEAYYTLNASYPSTGGAIWSEGKCDQDVFTETTVKPDYTGVDSYIPNLAPQELKILPGDPNVNGVAKRCYIYISDGTFYILAAHAGAEAPYDSNDSMIRLLSPGCTNTQNTFIITNTATRCW